MRRRHRIVHWYMWIVLTIMIALGVSIGLLLKQDPPPISQPVTD